MRINIGFSFLRKQESYSILIKALLNKIPCLRIVSQGMIIVFFLTGLNTTAQVTESGNFHSKLNGLIVSAPASGSGLYSIASPTEKATWETALTNLFVGNFSTCHTELSSIEYQLTVYTNTSQVPNKTYYILEKQNAGTNYWGIYVYNPNACNSNLVIQSPHAKYDSNTGQEGALVFTHADAFFFMVNGTHRCDHSSFSSCSGTTSSCGTSQNFRISDMSHNDNSIFQVTTSYLLNQSTSHYFVQLHGFGKQPTDPSVIMSNGTRNAPVQDYIGAIQQNLYAIDNNLDFKIAHIDISWTRLIGFTNTQGRLINGESAPCTNSASSTNGRFIHLEQEKPLLRQDSTKWAIMAEAIKLSFDCSVSIEESPEKSISIYPNPTNGLIMIDGDYKSATIINLLGQNVKNFPSSHKLISISNLKSGSYLLKIELKSGVIIVEKVVLYH